MKILGINFGSNNEKLSEPAIVNLEENVDNTAKFEFGIVCDNGMVAQNNSGRGYANFGLNNHYPDLLKSFRAGSSIHAAVLRWKEQTTVGNGYTIDTTQLKGMQIIEANQITSLFDGEESLEEALDKLAENYWMYGSMYVKLHFNDDHTKVVKREVIASDKIRWEYPDSTGKFYSFYYCWDWYYTGRFPILKYAKYDPSNKRDKIQILSFGIPSPTSQFYTLPSYDSAREWLSIDTNIPKSQDSNIKNSIQPSIAITLTKVPGSPEDRRKALASIESNFKGMRNHGNAMVMFAEKGYEPIIDVLPASQLDKQFENLTDSAQRSIVMAHGISPFLIGYKTAGSLGGGEELPVAFELAKTTTIVPAQRDINKFVNKIFRLNGLNVNFKLAEPKLILPA